MGARYMRVALVLIAAVWGPGSSRGQTNDMLGQLHSKFSAAPPSEIRATLDLLEQGNTVIKLNENYRDIVLVLGNTGAGKSTFTQWVTGTTLESIQTSGEFIIVDKNNRIGRKNIISQTIYPEFVIDNTTGTVFCDFPGFSDTRSTSHEIAASYFINKIVRDFKRVKIIFVVNYTSLRISVDRQDFKTFIKHATELVRNIEKFQNSIALVATKVDNTYRKSELVGDDTIKTYIADFMQEVKQELVSLLGKEQYLKAIKLIDVFLLKDGNNYRNIGLFRRPDDTDLLYKFDYLNDEKEIIREILSKKLTFTATNNDDFGHTISAKSENDINDIVQQIHANVLLSVNKVAEEIKLYYRNLESDLQIKIIFLNNSHVKLELTEALLSSAQIDLTRFIKGRNMFAELVTDIKTLLTPNELSSKINECITKLNITVSQETVFNIWYQGDYLKFLKEVSNEKFNSSTVVPAWAFYFDSVVNELTEPSIRIQTNYENITKIFENKIKSNIKMSCKEIWNYFSNREVQNYDIKKIFDDFSTYHNALSRLQFNIVNLAPHGYIKQVKVNFPFVDFKFSDYIMSKIVTDDKYFNVLKNEIDTLLKYLDSSQKWYNFLHMLYERLSEYDIQNNVNLYLESTSEIDQYRQPTDLEKFLKLCCNKEYINKFGYNQIKNIILNTPKLDALKNIIQLTLRSNMDFSFEETGQKVVIKGQYIKTKDLWMTYQNQIKHIEILALEKVFIDNDLNYFGKNITLSIISPTWDIQGDRRIILDGAPGKPHAESAAAGYDGKQGLPGGSGGMFFGIGRTFINGQRLIISADGGVGGPGQHGGEGGRGKDGVTPILIRNYAFHWGGYRITDEYTQLNFDHDIINEESFEQHGYYTSNTRTILHYEIYRSCTNGGNGRNSGPGGDGGSPGVINLLSMSKYNTVVKRNEVGEVGYSGTGGQGGPPGKSGQMMVMQQSTACFFVCRTDYSVLTMKDMKPCRPGNRGDSNNNPVANNMKKSLKDVQMIGSYRVLNSYKCYLRQNLMKIMKETTLNFFLHELENNESIFKLYDIAGYLNDLISLEKQFSIMRKKLSFLPYYQSFYNRLDKVLKNTDYRYVEKYKNVFKYLRMTTMVRIYSIKNNIANYMVIDIIKYLTIIKEHIEVYEKALKEVEIDFYNNQYKNSIISEISAANNLIENFVSPEIDKIYEKVDTQIGLLIEDIVKQQKKAEKQRNDLIEKRKTLASQILFKAGLGSLTFVSKFFTFLGPMGELANQVTATGAKVIEDNLLEDTNFPTVETAKKLNAVIDYYKREQECLKNNLEGILQDIIKTNNVENQIVLDKIKSLQAILSDNNSNQKIYYEVKLRTKRELSNYLKELLCEKEKELKQKSNTERRRRRSTTGSVKNTLPEINNVTSRIVVVLRLKNAITIAEAGYDLFKSFGKNNYKTAVLDDSINQLSEKITKLKEYEQTIHDVLLPMKNSFENSLKLLARSSSNQPQAILDVNKWKIQNIVKDFQTHVQYMVEVSDPMIKLELMACIEKLQNGMQTMLQIFDRIQMYNDRAIEASVTDIKELRGDVNDLELTRRSILILQEYEKASSAFIQHVYPFAGLYLEHLEFTDNLQPNNISELVHNAVEKLNFMRTELTISTTVINTKGFTLFPKIRFDSNNIDKKPFFVWEHETHRDEISSLLQGQEVTLKADVDEGIKQNAVKFNEIGIRFISANMSLQNELDHDLEHFLVRMIHRGNSYFRCDEKYHVIRHNVVRIKHSVTKDVDGHYRHLDETAQHLERSAPMCSPYTTWSIQLENKNEESFDILKKYSQQEIDVALEGWGQYIELGLQVCKVDLKKYYKEVHLV